MNKIKVVKKGSKPNTVTPAEQHYPRVEPIQKKFCVARGGSGFKRFKVMHDDKSAALAEAKRLAESTGNTYLILEVTAKVHGKPKTVPKGDSVSK